MDGPPSTETTVPAGHVQGALPGPQGICHRLKETTTVASLDWLAWGRETNTKEKWVGQQGKSPQTCHALKGPDLHHEEVFSVPQEVEEVGD